MKTRVFCSLITMGLLGGCVSGGSSKDGKLERWTNFDGKTLAAPPVGDQQVRAIFMRAQGAIDGPAVNVFVDGDYLASLLAGGYRSTTICSHGEKILPSFSKNNRFADRDSGIDYHFVMGETAYVNVVSDAHGQPIFERLSPDQGKRLLATLKQETQTLPRVKDNRACQQPVMKKFVLQAQALFKFNQSDYPNMLPQGRKELAVLADSLSRQQAGITQIKVLGYTDAMGRVEYNRHLSKQRAVTVAKVLNDSGIRVPIETEGLGASHLLVRNCLQKHQYNRSARIACDQPNRRVEIIVYGNTPPSQ